MKKFTLLLLFVSAFIYQRSAAQAVSVKAGALLSDWRGEGINTLNSLVGLTGDYITRSPYIGYYAGATINIPVATQLSFEPGFIYSQTGTSLKGKFGIKGIDILNAEANMIQQSIEMPLMIKAELGSGFEVMAGPQASYLLNSKLQVKASALGFNLINKSYDLDVNFEPFNVSAVAGFQYRLSNGLGIQAMYEHGLTSMVKDRSAKVYAQSGRVGLSYRF